MAGEINPHTGVPDIWNEPEQPSDKFSLSAYLEAGF